MAPLFVHHRWICTLRHRLALMTMLTTLASGCASTPCRFRAVGTIGTPATIETAGAPPLRVVIADALNPLGFTGGESENDGAYFYTLGGHAFLPRERIDVILNPDAREVGLIDYNHSTETDFVKKVLESMERETLSAYGVKVDIEPRANRWTDCLGP